MESTLETGSETAPETATEYALETALIPPKQGINMEPGCSMGIHSLIGILILTSSLETFWTSGINFIFGYFASSFKD